MVRNGHNHGHNNKIKVKLVRKCPSTNCKGFLNSKWHCDLCTKNICKDCNEEKTEGHECDPETVETVKLIRSDTKGCPTCGTLIYRAAGCPQMWCVEVSSWGRRPQVVECFRLKVHFANARELDFAVSHNL